MATKTVMLVEIFDWKPIRLRAQSWAEHVTGEEYRAANFPPAAKGCQEKKVCDSGPNARFPDVARNDKLINTESNARPCLFSDLQEDRTFLARSLRRAPESASWNAA